MKWENPPKTWFSKHENVKIHNHPGPESPPTNLVYSLDVQCIQKVFIVLHIFHVLLSNCPDLKLIDFPQKIPQNFHPVPIQSLTKSEFDVIANILKIKNKNKKKMQKIKCMNLSILNFSCILFPVYSHLIKVVKIYLEFLLHHLKSSSKRSQV